MWEMGRDGRWEMVEVGEAAEAGGEAVRWGGISPEYVWRQPRCSAPGMPSRLRQELSV